MTLFINIILGLLAIYFIAGLLFGIYFLLKAPSIDPLLGNSKKKVRFLLFPGVIATWPFFITKLFKRT